MACVPRDTCNRVSLGQSGKKTVKDWRITSVKYDKLFILITETFKGKPQGSQKRWFNDFLKKIETNTFTKAVLRQDMLRDGLQFLYVIRTTTVHNLGGTIYSSGAKTSDFKVPTLSVFIVCSEVQKIAIYNIFLL